MNKKKKTMVAPSILSGDFANMGKSVALLEEWGADIVHCDVMDGVYVNNITFGMPMIEAIKQYTKLPLDVHLMITEPEKYILDFIKSGADYLSFHPEVSKDPISVIQTIKANKVKAGVVLNADVPCDKWLYLLKYCDFVLVMSVQAGMGGQKFKPESLDKVRTIQKYVDINNISVDIEIDGGITEDNAKVVRDAGVNIIVAGSAVYKSKNPALSISKIRGDI